MVQENRSGIESNYKHLEFGLAHCIFCCQSWLWIRLPIRRFENEFDFGKNVIDGVLSGTEKTELWKDAGDSVDLPHGTAIRAENATLRELHALLKAKDPGFGGLVRVMNKRQEFLWVHEKFASEY